MIKVILALCLTVGFFLLFAKLYKMVLMKKRAMLPADIGVHTTFSIDFKRRVHVFRYLGDDYLILTGGPNDVMIKGESLSKQSDTLS